MGEIVSTSVHRHLSSRMMWVHEQASIGAFAGPPGLGKTTAAQQFIDATSGGAVLVTLRLPNAKTVLVLQEVLAAIRRAIRYPSDHQPSSKRELLSALRNAIEEWGSRHGCGSDCALSVVFDEAQNLSPEAIEALRFWNDAADEGHQPIGLIFLGNHQFQLEEKRGSPGFLSAAVRSRASYLKTFDYKDLTDDDLSLFIDSSGNFAADAVALMLGRCRARLFHRDLRQLGRDLAALNDIAAGSQVTAATVRTALGLN